MKKLFAFLLLTFISTAAFANAQVSQKEWRWRTDNGTETSAPWLSAQDAPYTMTSCSPDDTIRLRVGFLVAPDPAFPSSTASRNLPFNISYGPTPTGPWTTITTSTANAFVMANSSTVADNTPTTQQLVSGPGTFAQGIVMTAAHVTTIMFSTPPATTTLTEHEWVIKPTANAQSQTYYFMLVGLQSYPNPLPSLTIVANSSSTQSVTTCGSYVSPSGNYTWTTSGTYNDTIPNAVGCDSVITTNLTVAGSSASTLSASSCSSYVSPSGNYTWTMSGTYSDTIPNVSGCDSVITINLTILSASSGSFSETACDSYVSPSGNYTWTSSGTYNDTIPNAAGCDSVITVSLTILTSSTNEMTVSACDSYTSPSGNYTWTTSGTYNDTLPNMMGCDSLFIIDLTIRATSTASITVASCDSYTSPSGNYTWMTSGIYNDTIMNTTGCDSVIVIDLSILNSSMNQVTASACDSYVSPSGNYTWTASGVYNDTLTNAAGCDSVIVTTLTILNNSSTMSVITCDSSYMSPSGNYTWTTSGVYNDTIANSAGCDSVITVNLTMNVASMSSINETACDSYVSPSGNYTWTVSGVYTDTIANMVGCDSVITVNLVINTVNTATTFLNETITASASGATYQWVDCNNNNTPIAGATNQSYTATVNGSYAVLVTQNGCTSMSSCTAITTVGIGETASGPAVTLYPNPNSGSFFIETSTNVTVEVFDAVGQVVVSKQLNAGRNTIELENAVSGLYFVSVSDASGNKTVQRIVVQ